MAILWLLLQLLFSTAAPSPHSSDGTLELNPVELVVVAVVPPLATLAADAPLLLSLLPGLGAIPPIPGLGDVPITGTELPAADHLFARALDNISSPMAQDADSSRDSSDSPPRACRLISRIISLISLTSFVLFSLTELAVSIIAFLTSASIICRTSCPPPCTLEPAAPP